MDHRIKDTIQKHSKNPESANELESLFKKLLEKKKQAEKHLSLLENAIKSDYDSILITELDLEKPSPRIEYVNEGFTKMTGYSREEVIGKTPRILQGEKTSRAVLDKLKRRLKEGQAFFGHTVNYRKDGSEFINQWDIHPLTNSEGKVTHWVSYQHDITERKRSEKKVVDTGIEFDRLDEESKKTLADIDELGNIISSNKAFRDLVGYDEQELRKKKIWELLSNPFAENFRLRFDSFKSSDFDKQSYELELINKIGNSIEVEVTVRLLSSSGQKIIRIAFQNKTLQKRIISMIISRENDLDNMFDVLKDFNYKLIPTSSGQFTFDYVSESFTDITGIKSTEVEKIELLDFIHHDDIQKVLNHFHVVLEGKPNTEQFRIKTKDGSYINVIDYAKPDWDTETENVKAIKGATSTEVSSEG